MARGNEIIVSSDPRGHFVEGIIDTAEVPGTIVQVDATQAIVGTRWHWIVYTPGTTGFRPKGPYIVLLPDQLQGKTATDAYVAGKRAFGYIPLPGDELNLLYKNLTGTADDHAKGEVGIVDNATGKIVVTTGSPQSQPVVLLETITDPTADTLAWVLWTGY